MTILPSIRAFCIVALWVTLAVPAAAQDIPRNIPDDPTESPADRQREELRERNREAVSSFFVANNLAAAPALGRYSPAASYQFEVGFDREGASAIYLTLGARRYATLERDAFGPARSETAGLFMLGYDLGLDRFTDDARFDRAAIGFGIGGVYGGNAGRLTVDVAPKYTFPINRYWSLPVGLRVGQTILGTFADSVRTTFIGASIGVKLHFGHRPFFR